MQTGVVTRTYFQEGEKGWFGVFLAFLFLFFPFFFSWGNQKPKELQLDYFPVQTAVLV